MKLNLKTTFFGLDKKPIHDKQTYALAERIEGKITPITVGENVLAITQTGDLLTLQTVLSQHLLSENKEEKESRCKLGWKILMCEEDTFEIGDTDLVLLKKVILEKETTGIMLVQILDALV